MNWVAWSYSIHFQGFSHVIPEKNKVALDRISEVLDEKVIRQQADQGTLDFKSYSNFVIEWMAKLCAPVRDASIKELNQIDDVVIIFRRILEVMDLMKLDMANFYLDSVRKQIILHSIEYEKQKFNEFLKTYSGEFELFSIKMSSVRKSAFEMRI